ncbi:MAG TPA: hypothetical protein VEZ50_10375, partial [Nodosilinea sp.]|nr:hypothetical protein [Nodosilinea sp.]
SANPGAAVRLMGGTVVNTGTITAPGGEITLAAVPGSSTVRISQPGQILSLEVEAAALQSLAAGGTLPVTSLPALLTGGLPTSGLAVNSMGQAVLTATNTVIPEGQVAIASGQLNTANPEGLGGTVAVLGDRVGLFNATLDASGQTGGGQILVGGGYQGQGPVPNASRTFVDDGTTLAANALTRGNGGEAIVWADGATTFLGNIQLRGGAEAGNGGFAEVSGREFLDYRGRVDASASNGAIGTLLLDPTNIEVVADDFDSDALDLVDNFSDPDFDPTNQRTRLSVNAINDSVADVELQAANDITFNADVNLIGFGYGLSVTAGNRIDVNNSIQLNGGDFVANSAFFDASGITIATEGGEIRITTTGGDIVAGDLNTSVLSGFNGFSDTDGGDVTLSSTGGIAVNAITTSASQPYEGPANGGNIALMANGSISIDDDLQASSDHGRGGDITVMSRNGSANLGNLDAAGRDRGGNVTVIARESITAGRIATSSESGDGGNVLLDPTGDIQVTFIDAQGGSQSIGGTVDITTDRFFRATSTFVDQNNIPASISTAGGAGGGPITIRHGGGLLATPFTVGPDYTGINGTAGAITTGPNNTISEGAFPTTYQQGENPSIQIITQQPPDPPKPPEPPIPGEALQIETQGEPPPDLPPTEFSPPQTQAQIKDLNEARDILRQIENATGIKPALVYVQFIPARLAVEPDSNAAAATSEVEPPEIETIRSDPGTNFAQSEASYTQRFESYLALPNTPTQAPVNRQADTDQLELMVITADGPPIWKRVDVSREKVLATAQRFRLEVADP